MLPVGSGVRGAASCPERLAAPSHDAASASAARRGAPGETPCPPRYAHGRLANGTNARPPAPSEEESAQFSPAERALRRRTVGWLTGVVQAWGTAVLLVTELFRGDLGTLRQVGASAGRLPEYATEFGEVARAVAGEWWHTAALDIWERMTFGEPRAALWAAVCCALVVRLNREGPPRTQCGLSVVAAAYCLVAGVVGVPFLLLAGWFALPFVLLAGVVAIVLTTRR